MPCSQLGRGGVNTTKGAQKSWRGVALSSFQCGNMRAFATRKDFQRSRAKGMRCSLLSSPVVRAKGRGLPEPLPALPVLPDPSNAELLRALRFPPLTQKSSWQQRESLAQITDPTQDAWHRPSTPCQPPAHPWPHVADPGPTTQLDHTCLPSGWASPAVPAASVPAAGCRVLPG